MFGTVLPNGRLLGQSVADASALLRNTGWGQPVVPVWRRTLRGGGKCEGVEGWRNWRGGFARRLAGRSGRGRFRCCSIGGGIICRSISQRASSPMHRWLEARVGGGGCELRGGRVNLHRAAGACQEHGGDAGVCAQVCGRGGRAVHLDRLRYAGAGAVASGEREAGAGRERSAGGGLSAGVREGPFDFAQGRPAVAAACDRAARTAS